MGTLINVNKAKAISVLVLHIELPANETMIQDSIDLNLSGCKWKVVALSFFYPSYYPAPKKGKTFIK